MSAASLVRFEFRTPRNPIPPWAAAYGLPRIGVAGHPMVISYIR